MFEGKCLNYMILWVKRLNRSLRTNSSRKKWGITEEGTVITPYFGPKANLVQTLTEVEHHYEPPENVSFSVISREQRAEGEGTERLFWKATARALAKPSHSHCRFQAQELGSSAQLTV